MSKNAPEKNTQASFCLPLQGPLQGHTTEVLEIVNCAGHEIVKIIEISNEKSECCGETAIFESDRERERNSLKNKPKHCLQTRAITVRFSGIFFHGQQQARRGFESMTKSRNVQNRSVEKSLHKTTKKHLNIEWPSQKKIEISGCVGSQRQIHEPHDRMTLQASIC